METMEAFRLSATIHRGFRLILKNSFIHAEQDDVYPLNADPRCRSHSAPAPERRSSLAEPVSKIPSEFRGKTTVMIRNIPTRFTQESLLWVICDEFSESCMDFFYLPIDFKTGKNLGYCFINFTNSEFLMSFMRLFESRKLNANSEKLLSVSLAKIQGLEKNFNLFKVSAVMTVAPPKFRPMVICENCGRLAPLANSSDQCAALVVCDC